LTWMAEDKGVNWFATFYRRFGSGRHYDLEKKGSVGSRGEWDGGAFEGGKKSLSSHQEQGGESRKFISFCGKTAEKGGSYRCAEDLRKRGGEKWLILWSGFVKRGSIWGGKSQMLA